MFQKNLPTCFDVAYSRRSDRTRKTTNVTTYKQNEHSIILLADSKILDSPSLVYDMAWIGKIDLELHTNFVRPFSCKLQLDFPWQ